MKKYLWRLMTIMMVAMMSVSFVACGDDDNDEDVNGGNGGNEVAGTFSIIGTWKYFFVSNDPSRGQVYNLLTFNSDHSGYLIEEVGYGSDKPDYFSWSQSGNTIRIDFGGDDVETWTIVSVVDKNTAVISNGKKQLTVYRDSSGNGGTENGGGTATNDTINNPMTVAQIYDIVTGMEKDRVSDFNFCVKGKICSIKFPFSDEYGTAVFNISDDGYTSNTQFTVYSTYYKAFGRKWVTGNTQIAVGDEVVVFGKVVYYLGKTPEFAERQSYIVTINGK